MKPEIFVSYSREDQDQVYPIVEKLRQRGLKIWIDQEGIHGAKLWSQEIVNAIESSKVFILFASSKAFNSKNVTKELALASESDKHILPVFIEEAEIPAAMKYQLAGIQHLAHEEEHEDQTAAKILLTLGNLDIQSSEIQPQPATKQNSTKKSVSKNTMLAVSLILAISLIALLLFRKDAMQKIPQSSATEKTFKSTIDVCLVSTQEDDSHSEVSQENRNLRDELLAKLSRFHDYKIIRGKAISPDATTQQFVELANNVNADFILQTTIRRNKKSISAQLFDARDGNNFWSQTFREEKLKIDEDFLEETTALLSAQIAGHDGIIHREILQNARVKNDDDLSPIELLQIGKATWENMTKETTLKAIDYLNRCVSLNPDISTAYALLSEIYIEDIRRKYNVTIEPLKKAKEAAKRAIELDSKNSIALIEKLWISWYEKDFTACELQIDLALEANPYEPLVLISSASFRIITDRDSELGKKHADLAIKYNQTPQGWYYWPQEVYYARKKDFKKAQEYILKSNYSDDHGVAEVAILHWLNNEKESALLRYADVLQINPNYTVDEYIEWQNIWSEKDLESYPVALEEIVEAYNKEKNNFQNSKTVSRER